MNIASRITRSFPIQKDRATIGFYIGITILLFLNMWSLMRYPAPYPDEATLISRAWNYISTGHAFGMLDSGIAEAYDQYWIIYQWLITFLYSLVLRFLTAPSLLALRSFSLFLGILLLAVTFFLAKRLGGKEVAYISVLLLTSSTAFLHSAHQVRYDIFAALLSYTSLALVVLDSRGRFWVGLIAGLVIGLAVETHLNSLIFLPSIGVVYLVNSGWRFYKNSSVWGYALGCLGGVLYYLGLHYLPNPETALFINSFAFGTSKQPPILSLNLGKIILALLEVSKLLLVSSGSMILLAILAIPPLLASRSQEGRILLGVNAALILTAGLIMPSKTGHYSIYLAPAFLILIATYLRYFLSLLWRGRLQDYLMRVMVWGLAVGGIALGISVVLPDQYADYKKIQAGLNSVVNSQDTVMGVQTYWLGMPEIRYRSWELVFQYQGLHPGTTLEEAINHFGTTVFIIDPELRNLIADNVDPASPWYNYHLSKIELDQFLARRGERVFNREYSPGGWFEVYRIERGD